jgi:Zn-dependent peptidase ImmA (M78 family)
VLERSYEGIPVPLSRKSRMLTSSALSDLQLQPGMLAQDVVDAVATVLGKPIFLEQTVDERFKKTTGSFALTPDFVLIVFRGIDPQAYQMHSLFHELGHLLCRHNECIRPGTQLETETPDVVLWSQAEREAEFLAFKIASLINRKSRSVQAFG